MTRKLLAAAAMLLGTTLVAPLWSARMEAPQYHGEEALMVRVYSGHIDGDLKEIETLNQYVGVHLPLDTPEMRAMPWVLGFLLALAGLSLLLPAGRHRAAAAVLLVLMVTAAATGAVMLQIRLYNLGHVRTHTILEGVPDFTPPLLGTVKAANFTAHMSLGLGGYAYAVACLLLGWTVWAGKGPARQTRKNGNAGREDANRHVHVNCT